MRVLLIYLLWSKSFWSFDKTIELIGPKGNLPSLGMTTLAAILPQEWERRLADRNVRNVIENQRRAFARAG